MLLPYATDRPPIKPPITVVLLVLVQFSLFGLFAFGVNSRTGSAWIGLYANLSLIPGSIKWYAPFTYSFLHERVFHLSANMLFLWVFGSSLEDALKWKRFLSLYIAAGVVTGLLQCLMTVKMPSADPMIPVVGASGAISALVGVFAVRFYRSKIRFIGMPVQVPAIGLLVTILVAEMAYSIWNIVQHIHGVHLDSSAHWAHIGGFFIGVGYAQLTRQFQSGKHEYMETDARSAAKKGTPLDAVRRWQSVLDVQPKSYAAMSELAQAWAESGDKEQSVELFHRSIETALLNGNRQIAVETYLRMNKLWGNAMPTSESQYKMAGWLEEQNKFEDARNAFSLLISQYMDSPEREMSHIRVGVLELKKLNRPGAAVEFLESFLRQYPDSEWTGYAYDLVKLAREPKR